MRPVRPLDRAILTTSKTPHHRNTGLGAVPGKITRWVTNGMLVARKQRYRPVCHHPDQAKDGNSHPLGGPPHRGDLVLLLSLVRTFLRKPRAVLSKLGRRYGFSACILLKRLRRVGARCRRISDLPIHQRHHCMEAQPPTLSSRPERSAVEGPAVRLGQAKNAPGR